MLIDILGRELVSENFVIWDLHTNDKDVQGRYGLVISNTKMYTLSKGFVNYDTTDCICYAITTPTNYELQIYNLLKQSYSVKIHNSMRSYVKEEKTKVESSPSRLNSIKNKLNFFKFHLDVGDVFEAYNGLYVIYLGKIQIITDNISRNACGYAYLTVSQGWLLQNYFDLGYYLKCNRCCVSYSKRFFDKSLSILSYEIKDKDAINHVNIESGRYPCECSLYDGFGVYDATINIR